MTGATGAVGASCCGAAWGTSMAGDAPYLAGREKTVNFGSGAFSELVATFSALAFFLTACKICFSSV